MAEAVRKKEKKKETVRNAVVVDDVDETKPKEPTPPSSLSISTSKIIEQLEVPSAPPIVIEQSNTGIEQNSNQNQNATTSTIENSKELDTSRTKTNENKIELNSNELGHINKESNQSIEQKKEMVKSETMAKKEDLSSHSLMEKEKELEIEKSKTISIEKQSIIEQSIEKSNGIFFFLDHYFTLFFFFNTNKHKNIVSYALPLEHSIAIEKSRLQTLVTDLQKVLVIEERAQQRIQTQTIVFDPFSVSSQVTQQDDKLFRLLQEYRNSLEQQQHAENELSTTLAQSNALLPTIWEEEMKKATFSAVCADGNTVVLNLEDKVFVFHPKHADEFQMSLNNAKKIYGEVKRKGKCIICVT